MDLLLITNGNKSHYVCIKDSIKFCAMRQKIKIKKHFCKYCLHYFSSERVLIEHKKTRLIINGKQSVKLRSVSIKFKNHFKQ